MPIPRPSKSMWNGGCRRDTETHFRHHRVVTTATSDDIADVEEIDDKPCNKSSAGGSLMVVLEHLENAHLTTATHSECSNSQWP